MSSASSPKRVARWSAPRAATPTTPEFVLGEVRTLTAELTVAEPDAPAVEAGPEEPEELPVALR